MKYHLFIVLFVSLNLGTAFAETASGPTPIEVLDGEKYGHRSITLLHNGKVAHVPHEHSIIDQDGSVYSLEVRNTYTQQYNPATKSFISICVGSDLTATVDGTHVLSRHFSSCMGKPIFSARKGRFFIQVSGPGIFGGSSSYLLPNRTLKRVAGIASAQAVAFADDRYYVVSLKGMHNQLVLYAFDEDFDLVQTHYLDKHAASPHIVVDRRGRPHVTYYNAKSRTLHYARMEGNDFRSHVLDTPDSGFENSIDADDADVVIAAYYMRNPYNKGIRLYRIPIETGSMPNTLSGHFFLRRKDENIGWSPAISTNGTHVALSVYNKTIDKTEVFLLNKDDIDAQNDTRPEWLKPWMEKHKKLNLYTELGFSFVQWHTKVSTDFHGATISSGRYEIEPTVLEEFGFGGEYETVSFGFEYMNNVLFGREKDRADEKDEALEYAMGRIGINDLIGYGKTLEVHTRVGRLEGTYNNSGSIQDFETKYFDLDVDIFDKRGGVFYGLGYRSFRTPQPIVVTLNNSVVEQYVTNVDFDLYSVLVGYSNLNYLRRFENRFSGFYLDGKAYVGLGNADLAQEPSVATFSSRPFVVRANADAGYMIFRRMQSLGYLSYFIKAGVHADYSYITDVEPDREKDEQVNKATINIDRQDFIYGVFLRAGITF